MRAFSRRGARSREAARVGGGAPTRLTRVGPHAHRLSDHVTAAAARLQSAGMARAEAANSAAALARFVLGWSGADWVARSRDAVPRGFWDRFDRLIERRARHEPVAYITGEREFYGRPFRVTPDVLIPRPETELIVDLALQLPAAPSFIIDAGTGSGCLAITLALEFPSAQVMATDISDAALAVARGNAARLGVADRIEFRHAAIKDLGGRFTNTDKRPPRSCVDLIVANPPYIDPADRASLPHDVADHEPAVALFAEEHGLAVIRALIDRAPAVLASGGTLLIEIGQGQAAAVRDMIEHTRALTFIEIRPDLQGIPRTLVAHSDRSRCEGVKKQA
jgi:release factor glutamine methyltransferase